MDEIYNRNEDVEDKIEGIGRVIDEQELYNTFYGTSCDYYRKRQEELQSGKKISFSFYAFFLGFFWLGYRKMYKELLILFGSISIINIFSLLIVPESSSLDRVLNMFISVTIGAYANYFYIKKAERTINEARLIYAEEGDQLEYIRSKGGTNAWAPVIVGVCLISIGITYFILLDFGSLI